MARIGIFSGTFDPVHKGHIAFCLAAIAAAGLDRVVLLPEPEPRGKDHAAPLAHRLAMLRLAIQTEPSLDVVTLPGQRFSVAETLPELQRRFAGDELSLLVGSDVVRSFEHGWPGLPQLLGHMRLVIGLRGNDTQTDMEQALAAVSRRFPAVPYIRSILVGSPQPLAASSAVRARGPRAAGVAPPVAAYIATHQLYATPA